MVLVWGTILWVDDGAQHKQVRTCENMFGFRLDEWLPSFMFYCYLLFIPLTELPQAHDCFIVVLVDRQVDQVRPASGGLESDHVVS